MDEWLTCVKQRRDFGPEELLTAVQALMIYMIMRFVDGRTEPKDMNAMLVVSYQVSLCAPAIIVTSEG
jgi:hypothetical protein